MENNHMKDGYWNYTEPIKYRALIVKPLPVKRPVLHWQNAFVDQERQVIEVTMDSSFAARVYSFMIDNEDGLGWLKIQKGGGPDMPSRHMREVQVIRVCSDDEMIREMDLDKRFRIDAAINVWGEQAFPEEWAKMQKLRAAAEDAIGNKKRWF